MLNNPEQTKNEIIDWIREYFNKNLPKANAVVGISGGKDSSVVATLCAEALGKERVVGVTMPNGKQSDIDDSYTLINHLGINTIEVNIGEISDAFLHTFETNEKFKNLSETGSLSRNSIINYPPRMRMSVLYAIAQSLPNGGLVANTCNKSEDYVGYSTKFGDSAGDFSPLANLTVHEVLQIGRVLNLPEQLVNKAPSDGLSGMTDEEKLGFTYEALDNYIDTGICEDETTKARIDYLHKINLHKIQPMPAFEK